MGLLDAISPTPRNRILGLLADATQGVNDFASKPFGYDNPPARMLMGLLGVPSIATTLDRLSYGEPLTNIGKANVPLLKPETADAAMAAAAALPAVSRGALKASDAAVRAITRNPEATATKVMDYAAQMNPMNPMVVYHGSPHKFDKFDSSKIGTGEGAQAYGHGLYLAESPGVARSYAEQLSTPIGPGGDVAKYWRANGGETAFRAFARDAGLTTQEVEEVAKSIANTGSLYKVDLPDSAIAKMLDWDKPLSQQAAEVQAAVKPLLKDIFDVREYGGGWGSLEPDVNAVRDVYTKSGHSLGTYSSADADNLNFTGSAIVKALGNMDKESAATAALLRKAGIPGIRYLDGGSRGAGAGTSNFVVFPGEESLLSILERNGVPLK